MAGVTAVWLGGLDGTTWWAEHADESVYAASLVKVVWATAAQRRADRGELDLGARVVVHADFGSVVGGVPFVLDRADDQDDDTWDALGRHESLAALRRRAVQLSGNLAADLLLERTGLAEVRAVLADAGCGPGTVMPAAIGDRPAREHGLRNVVTARDLGLLLARTPQPVEHLMCGQHYRDAVPSGLPQGTPVANKTGWVDGITHDMAIVRPTKEQGGEPFALAVLTAHDTTRDEADRRIAAVAATAWERRR